MRKIWRKTKKNVENRLSLDERKSGKGNKVIGKLETYMKEGKRTKSLFIFIFPIFTSFAFF